MNDGTPAAVRGSAALLWTLVAGSLGLTACIAVALLVVAALLRVS